jgi:hypothetical protein
VQLFLRSGLPFLVSMVSDHDVDADVLPFQVALQVRSVRDGISNKAPKLATLCWFA